MCLSLRAPLHPCRCCTGTGVRPQPPSRRTYSPPSNSTVSSSSSGCQPVNPRATAHWCCTASVKSSHSLPSAVAIIRPAFVGSCAPSTACLSGTGLLLRPPAACLYSCCVGCVHDVLQATRTGRVSPFRMWTPCTMRSSTPLAGWSFGCRAQQTQVSRGRGLQCHDAADSTVCGRRRDSYCTPINVHCGRSRSCPRSWSAAMHIDGVCYTDGFWALMSSVCTGTGSSCLLSQSSPPRCPL